MENPIGKGWHKNSQAHRKVGKKGGLVTAHMYGSEFYRAIGKKGGKVSGGNFAKNPQRAKEAGRKGGRMKNNSMTHSRLKFSPSL